MPEEFLSSEDKLLTLVDRLAALVPDHELVLIGENVKPKSNHIKDAKAFEDELIEVFAKRFWDPSKGDWREFSEWDVRVAIIENWTKEVEKALESFQ